METDRVKSGPVKETVKVEPVKSEDSAKAVPVKVVSMETVKVEPVKS